MKILLYYIVLTLFVILTTKGGAFAKALNHDQFLGVIQNTNNPSTVAGILLAEGYHHVRNRNGYQVENIEIGDGVADVYVREESETELMVDFSFFKKDLQKNSFEEISSNLIELLSRKFGNPYKVSNVNWWEDEGGDKRDVFLWRIDDRIVFINVRKFEDSIKYINVFASNFEILLKTRDVEESYFWRKISESSRASEAFKHQRFDFGNNASSGSGQVTSLHQSKSTHVESPNSVQVGGSNETKKWPWITTIVIIIVLLILAIFIVFLRSSKRKVQ